MAKWTWTNSSTVAQGCALEASPQICAHHLSHKAHSAEEQELLGHLAIQFAIQKRALTRQMCAMPNIHVQLSADPTAP